ncbi:MAG: hypothetical protein HOH43_07410 [Candidatus Latescibacteria bacterium]|nr:hypothetical protein [Candidatus Latescibacterota bacterium]
MSSATGTILPCRQAGSMVKPLFLVGLALIVLTGFASCRDNSGPSFPQPQLRRQLPTRTDGNVVRLNPKMRGDMLPVLTGLCYVPLEHTNLIREVDSKLLQLDQLFDIVIPVAMTSNGIQQDLSKIDPLLEGLRLSGAQPLITLDFTPSALSPRPHLENSKRRSAPPTSYGDWEQLVFELASYVVIEKGIGVAYWSVWNEPDLGMFWDVAHAGYTQYAATAPGSDLWTPGSKRTEAQGQFNEMARILEYMSLYEATVKGILRVDPSARVGGPNTSSFSKRWIAVVLNQCVERDLPLDFVAWHYPGSRTEITERVAWLRTKSASLGIGPPAVLITEWNADHGKGWEPWAEAMGSLDIIEGMAAAGVEASFYYTYGRLLDANPAKLTPMGKAFRFLGDMSGFQVGVSTTVGTNALGTIASDNSLRVLLWSDHPVDGRFSIQMDPSIPSDSYASCILEIVGEKGPSLTATYEDIADGRVEFSLPDAGRILAYLILSPSNEL